MVFGVKDSTPTFERLAVFSGNGDVVDRMPVITIVLVGGHYYAVNKLTPKANFPVSWVKDEGIVQITSLIDIDYKKPPFVRGGGGDGFVTPTKKGNPALEEHLLRTCQSATTSRFGGELQDSLLETYSSRRSGLLSVKKTIDKSNHKRGSQSKAPSFSDPAAVASAIRAGRKVTWTCSFCSWRCGVCKGDSMRVIKHIRSRHRAEYDLKIQEFKRLGIGKKRGISGFGIRGVKLPVDFTNLNAEQWKEARFVCPYCEKGSTLSLTRHEWLLAKRHHLRQCESKPKKKINLMRFFKDHVSSKHGAFRRSKSFSQRGQIFTKRAHDLAVKRGHDAVFFPVTGYFGIKVNIHMCRLCRARTGSSGWTRPCKRKSIRTFCSPSPTWWRRIAKDNDWKSVAQTLQISAKEKADISKMLEE